MLISISVGQDIHRQRGIPAGRPREEGFGTAVPEEANRTVMWIYPCAARRRPWSVTRQTPR